MAYVARSRVNSYGRSTFLNEVARQDRKDVEPPVFVCDTDDMGRRRWSLRVTDNASPVRYTVVLDEEEATRNLGRLAASLGYKLVKAAAA